MNTTYWITPATRSDLDRYAAGYDDNHAASFEEAVALVNSQEETNPDAGEWDIVEEGADGSRSRWRWNGRTWDETATARTRPDVDALRELLPLVRAEGATLAGLREHDRNAWLGAVRAVVHAARSIPLAAEACGVSERALRKWIEEEPRITRGAELPGRGRPRAV